MNLGDLQNPNATAQTVRTSKPKPIAGTFAINNQKGEKWREAALASVGVKAGPAAVTPMNPPAPAKRTAAEIAQTVSRLTKEQAERELRRKEEE